MRLGEITKRVFMNEKINKQALMDSNVEDKDVRGIQQRTLRRSSKGDTKKTGRM